MGTLAAKKSKRTWGVVLTLLWNARSRRRPRKSFRRRRSHAARIFQDRTRRGHPAELLLKRETWLSAALATRRDRPAGRLQPKTFPKSNDFERREGLRGRSHRSLSHFPFLTGRDTTSDQGLMLGGGLGPPSPMWRCAVRAELPRCERSVDPRPRTRRNLTRHIHRETVSYIHQCT